MEPSLPRGFWSVEADVRVSLVKGEVIPALLVRSARELSHFDPAGMGIPAAAVRNAADDAADGDVAGRQRYARFVDVLAGSHRARRSCDLEREAARSHVLDPRARLIREVQRRGSPLDAAAQRVAEAGLADCVRNGEPHQIVIPSQHGALEVVDRTAAQQNDRVLAVDGRTLVARVELLER